MDNCCNYIGEPAIIDGDLVKNDGDYQRVRGIDNAVLLLVGTESGYWGNLIEPETSQLPGGYEELSGEPITSSFLGTVEGRIGGCLAPLIPSIASEITVEASNPEADRIEWVAELLMIDGRKYWFDSATSAGHFVV